MYKSLWKLKEFTFTNIKLRGFNPLLLQNLEIFNKSTFNSKGSMLRVVNRFVCISFFYKLKNMNISIYNGKFFFIVKLKLSHFKTYFKFGELSYTRRIGLIHKAKKKSRLKKK